MHDATAAQTTLPDPQTDPFGALERELRVLIRRAQSTASHTAARIHPELNASAYPLLAHIADNPGTRGSDLAAHFGVGRATVSRQLSRLEALGLVHRAVDPADTRGQLITLTSDGAERFRRARDARIGMLEGALADWEKADVSQIAALLRLYSADVVTWLQQTRSPVIAADAPAAS
ncbi:MarR family winged helix-turn-helix transcriptional regulator [Isoptericola jiangsuensis]|uniref:MarR family winged helix-turn-helix transcriptional regulator n=1 Tax=Isoptericola jiangsuensis TaxID=548579 RepID=UPI003AADBD85